MSCIISQLSESIRHGSEVGKVVHADYLHLGAADGGTALAEETSYEYLLVHVENTSAFVLLESARPCAAETTARALIKCCALMSVPSVWVSDAAPLEVFIGRQSRTL